MADSLELGREAFARRDWQAAHAHLRTADLEAADLERLAVAAYLLGRDDDCADALERAHRAYLRSGDADRAARCACWLAIICLLAAEPARGGGWLARAERIIDDAGQPCAARGLALVPAFLEALGGGDAATATAIAAETVAIGRRFDDGDVLAFGLLTSGEAALAAGEIPRGMRLFDEVMVAVTGGEVSPITAGIMYCGVIEACVLAFDFGRAAEWTEALHRWCAEQPDLVPYRGQCRVHRSQVLQARGRWAEAAAEADRARELLSEPAHPALGIALYQRGEHRVCGELAAAEEAYRAASRVGYDPAAGLALLRVAESNIDAAVAAVERLGEERHLLLERPIVLVASVEVFLAAGDTPRARAASDELEAIAQQLRAPLLQMAAAFATGIVCIAEGDPRQALVALREARDQARHLGMPYDDARARLQIGIACRALGDIDAASMEIDAALAVFEELGAHPDLARARALASTSAAHPAGLTERECEVLRLVASGQTNRDIAAELVISEHTVARHLQNIFTKLGLSSRSAATAFAYEHGLVAPRGRN